MAMMMMLIMKMIPRINPKQRGTKSLEAERSSRITTTRTTPIPKEVESSKEVGSLTDSKKNCCLGCG